METGPGTLLLIGMGGRILQLSTPADPSRSALALKDRAGDTERS
jgi:hypothetical protein